MKIALTYDLKSDYLAMGFSPEAAAEFDSPETIDALAAVLERLGHEVQRVGHIRNLVDRLAGHARWDLVFNIAEGAFGPSRESQIPALLEAYEIPCAFSDSFQLSLCLNKALTKTVVAEAGFATAPYRVVRSPEEIRSDGMAYPLFAKPLFGGTSQGIGPASIVRDAQQLNSVCRQLLERFDQGVLIEEFLPGREFTVGVIGTGLSARSVGAMEILLTEKAEPGIYSYHNKQYYADRVVYRIETSETGRQACDLARGIWTRLGLKDGGRVDLRQDRRGRLCFIEVNPLAGLHPEIGDLPILCRLNGIPYETLIARIVESARTRYGI